MKIRLDYNSEEGTVSNLEVSTNGVDYDKIPIDEVSLQEDIVNAIQNYLDDLAYNNWLEI